MATKTQSKKTTVTKAPAKPKVNGDLIVVSKAASDNDQANHIVKAGDGRKLIIPTIRWAGDIRAASAPGQSFTAFEQLWAKANVAKLARGVDARQAPHAAKAVADNAAARKGTDKPKAPKPAKAKPVKATAAKGDRTYKAIVKLADIPLRDDTWTKVMVETAMAHTSTDAAAAALAKHRKFGDRKLDWKWLSDVRGYIKFA